jgi:hypothetical protein
MAAALFRLSDALGRIIRCETEKLALSVARYRRRRLCQLRERLLRARSRHPVIELMLTAATTSAAARHLSGRRGTTVIGVNS